VQRAAIDPGQLEQLVGTGCMATFGQQGIG
jgi:hypothetical protein